MSSPADPRPRVGDLLGAWAGPADHRTLPCASCGTCACEFHDGAEHRGQRYCLICVGRGHREEEAP